MFGISLMTKISEKTQRESELLLRVRKVTLITHAQAAGIQSILLQKNAR